MMKIMCPIFLLVTLLANTPIHAQGSIEILSPIPESYGNTPISIHAIARDMPDDFAYLKAFLINGSNPPIGRRSDQDKDPGDIYTLSTEWKVAPQDNGSYIIRIWAYNQNGATLTNQDISLTVQLIPYIEITTPTDSDKYTYELIPIRAKARNMPADFAYLKAFLIHGDNPQVGSRSDGDDDPIDPYFLNTHWNTVNQGNGTYSLRIWAYRRNGERIVSQDVNDISIAVEEAGDNRPFIQISNPSSWTSYRDPSSSVHVRARAFDMPDEFAYMQAFAITDENPTIGDRSDRDTDPDDPLYLNTIWNITPENSGIYPIEVQAYDENGKIITAQEVMVGVNIKDSSVSLNAFTPPYIAPPEKWIGSVGFEDLIQELDWAEIQDYVRIGNGLYIKKETFQKIQTVSVDISKAIMDNPEAVKFAVLGVNFVTIATLGQPIPVNQIVGLVKWSSRAVYLTASLLDVRYLPSVSRATLDIPLFNLPKVTPGWTKIQQIIENGAEIGEIDLTQFPNLQDEKPQLQNRLVIENQPGKEPYWRVVLPAVLDVAEDIALDVLLPEPEGPKPEKTKRKVELKPHNLTSDDITGFNVYAQKSGEYEKLNSAPITVSFYDDADSGAESYFIIVVDNEGNEQGTSNEVVVDNPILSILPSTRFVSHWHGTATFEVKNTGAGDLRWEATTTDPWLTIQNGLSGINDGTVAISYESNTGDLAQSRTGHITVTTATGDQQILIIEQADTKDFDIGTIPSQNIWENSSVSFRVHTDRLGEETFFSIEVLGDPRGELHFDPSTRLFKYAPSWPGPSEGVDRESFEVRFIASSGAESVAQTITIDPLPHLPSEERIIQNKKFTANPEDRKFIFRSETLSSDMVPFNYRNRKIRTVNLYGKILVFEKGHADSLLEVYNGAEDIDSLNIHADEVIFRSELWLPQTDITIYARVLRFEGNGRLQTTPVSLDDAPSPTQPQQSVAQPAGAGGLRAGDVALYIDEFHTDKDSTFKRFILKGGNGQPAVKGDPGISNIDIDVVGKDYWFLEGAPTWLDSTVHITVIQEGSSDGWPWSQTEYLPKDRRDPSGYWPISQPDAIAAGKPGNGGVGGDIRSTLEIVEEYTDKSGGQAGLLGETILSRGGRPHTAYHALIIEDYGNNGNNTPSITWTITDTFFTEEIIEIPPSLPDIAIGQEGLYEPIQQNALTLHPFALKMILAYARDAYLYGQFTEAESTLLQLRDYFAAYTGSEEAGNSISVQQLEIQQMQNEVEILLQRMASGLDYFGNPPGWVPMLSFEVSREIFRDEVDRAIRTLYLSYWLENSTRGIADDLAGLKQSKEKKAVEIDSLESRLVTSQLLLEDLQEEQRVINDTIQSVQEQLRSREAYLREQARSSLEPPLWESAFKTAAVLSSFIPAIAPAVQGIGTFAAGIAQLSGGKEVTSLSNGLEFLSHIDYSDPWDIVAGMGQVYETNKNPQDQLDTLLGKINEETKTLVDSLDKTRNLVNTDVNRIRLDETFTMVIDSVLNRSVFQTMSDLNRGSKNLSQRIADFNRQMVPRQVPQSELAKKLEELQLSDEVFQQLKRKIAALHNQNGILHQRLSQTLQNMTKNSNDIVQGFLAIDAMNRDISQKDAVLYPRAMAYVKDMEQRTRERLLKYHYYVAKAYEYRMLEPYPVDLNLLDYFDQIRSIALADSKLEMGEIEHLKALYEEAFSQIIKNIIANYQEPMYRSEEFHTIEPKTFTLSSEYLAQLNKGLPITINLMEDTKLITLREENIRLRKISIDSIKTHWENAEQVASGEISFYATHSGISRFRFRGEDFLFRHSYGEIFPPIRYNAVNNTISTDPRSDASKSLLYSLVNGDLDKTLLFSRPGGWADLEIAPLVTTDPPAAKIIIDSLRLAFTYDYAFVPPDSRIAQLKVITSDQLNPHYVIDTPDRNGRQDGRGHFYRAYKINEVVGIKAPKKLGRWEFDQWTDDKGNVLQPDTDSGPNELQVAINGNRTIQAKYVEVPFPDQVREVPLSTGWNWISFNILPQDTSVPAVMDSCENLIVMEDGYGRVYQPDLNNDIGKIDFRAGYQVNLSAPDTAIVFGFSIDSGYPIPLKKGWNWVGFLPEQPIAVASALHSIIDNLDIAQNDEGRFFYPRYDFDSMGYLSPGEGYKLFLSEPDTLIYPEPVAAKQLLVQERQIPLPKHFSFKAHTGEIHSVLVESAEGLAPGDEIAAFTEDGLCVGGTVWDGQTTSLPIWKDDSRTPEKDGWHPGDRLQFQVWKNTEDKTYQPQVSFVKGTGLMDGAPITIVRLIARAIPTEYALEPNYPNPFNPSTTLRYALPQAGRTKMAIYNMLGQQVRVLVDEWQQAGTYAIQWDGKDGSRREVGSGIYLCRMESGIFTRINKMVLLK